jgi:hypothetical protein
MSENEPKKKHVLMCVSRSQVSLDIAGRGVHFLPTQRMEVDEDDMGSPQLQKLLKAKFLVDVTASQERRAGAK